MATPGLSTAPKETRNPHRPPPPSLFVGPASRNASNISLDSTLNPLRQTATHTSAYKGTVPASTPIRAPLLRSRSTRGPDAPALPTITSPLGRSTQQQRQQQQQQQSEGDRTDALWAEMQATLAEVELSAARGTRFFGPEHSAALEELRTSQIALAQAWVRSETDEVVEHPGEKEEDNVKGAGVLGGEGEETKGMGKGMEEETEADILMARKRREANDRYFNRVNGGVLDVVGRLEEVATAMGKVERESREVWSESDSLGTESVAS